MSQHSTHASRPDAGGILVTSSTEKASPSCTSRTIVLGVTGGIAAYKSPAIVRALREAGHTVQVAPTYAALQMVGITVWEAVSGQPVYVDVTEAADEVVHVRTGSEADLIIIAPATANTIAKLAAGIADNLLTATALVATCPLLIAPAMHTQMWNHPATQANIDVLKKRGVHIIGPESGRLTGADSGIGRMSEPEDIVARALTLLTPELAQKRGLLSGRRVLISAGGTREAIDPVRFIGNRSTGRMGIALAAQAAQQGAEVELAAAHIESDLLAALPASVTVTTSVTAEELHAHMSESAKQADLIIMCAAVADYRPAAPSESKIKKTGNGIRTIELIENPDILADLAHHRRKEGQLILGFAAETGDDQHNALEYGKQKARRKGADIMAINHVSHTEGFGDVNTCVTLVNSKGEEVGSARGSKAEVAEAIITYCAQALQKMP